MNVSNTIIFRYFLLFLMSVLYLYAVIDRVYLNPFELKSDYLQYFNFYNLDENRLDRFGIEIALPLFFSFSNKLGFSFFDFCFLFGALWLIPILHISKVVKTKFLIFYFLFFIFYFVNDYSFLMRQYFAFFFFILYLFNSSRLKYVFLIFSFLSHISAIAFVLFSLLRFSSKRIYYTIFFLAVVSFFLNLYGYSLSKILFIINNINFGVHDLQRKLSLIIRLENTVDPGGFKNYIILIAAIFLNMLYLHLGGKNNRLLLVFFFGAIVSLLFSDFKILSNRFGFSAYFFSLPYLFYSASLLKTTSSWKLKLQRKSHVFNHSSII